jgi:archaellum component FlaC
MVIVFLTISDIKDEINHLEDSIYNNADDIDRLKDNVYDLDNRIDDLEYY